MAYEGVNGVAASSIEGVNGVAKSSIEGINGATTPSSGHSDLWVLVGKSGKIGTSTDGSNWTVYDQGSTDNWHAAYGLDGSGANVWAVCGSNNSAEIQYNDDPTDSDGWTNVNIAGSVNGRGLIFDASTSKWYFQNKTTSTTKVLFTSSADLTDANNWGSFDYSGVSSNYGTSYGVATNGSGTIMYGIRDDLVATSSAGLVGSANFLGSGKNINKGVAQGGGKWFITANNGKAAVSVDGGQNWDLTLGADIGGTSFSTDLNAIAYDGGANGTGTWIVVGGSAFMARSTNNGVDWTVIDHSATHTRKLQHIATNGSGTWVAVGDDGRIGTSTNHGAGWSWSDESIAADLKGVAINWKLPLIGFGS